MCIVYEGMEESVYVIQLCSKGNDDTREIKSDPQDKIDKLPSEYRYSARLALGLGVIHIGLGVISSCFTFLALLIEPEVNQLATGLWVGFVFVGTGLFGILAHSRWYVRNQILWFLLTSMVSLVASVSALTLNSLEIKLRFDYLAKHPPRYAFQSQVGGFVTANIFIASISEFVLSIFSIIFAYKGVNAKEFSSACKNDLRSSKALVGKHLKRKKTLVVSAEMPPGYSASGVLADPSLLCHLTDPDCNQYHVTRVNPLCKEEHALTLSTSASLCSSSSSSASTEFEFSKMSTVQHNENTRLADFLFHTARMNAKLTRHQVNMNPEHTFRSYAV